MDRTSSVRLSLAAGWAALILASGGAATAAPPDYMQAISGDVASTPAETANGDVLALNAAMFDLYGNSGQIFQKNILARHPVILGLFSGAGGRFILYRPGQPPLEAPPVPLGYQLLKSVGHSTMALAEVVAPFVDNPANQSWRGAMASYRSRMQAALANLDATDLPADYKANNHTILANNIAFMDACIAKGGFSQADLDAFGKRQAPFLAKNVTWAAHIQVAHWMKVIGDWKTMLGSDWDQTYAASNTIYVARQNNVLFSVLAQYFPPDAINDRLLLIETVSFTTTPQDMLEGLTRIISDRSVGSIFFGNYHLMDYELMGGDARNAIVEESAKLGRKAFLPPAVPFGSHQWPTLVTPGPGPTSIADLK